MTGTDFPASESVVDMPAGSRAPFRVLMRHRGGYDQQDLVDVQLQNVSDGSLIWAQTFSDPQQADTFADEVRDNLRELDDTTFRRKYAVPLSA
jgi:hypothetical protein